MMPTRKKREEEEGGEVEEMLRAAQDELLLKLSVDTHTHAHASCLPDDLDRRFQSLKSNRRPSPSFSSSSSKPVEEDADLLSRFAALKAASSPSTSAGGAGGVVHAPVGSGDEEDEVEKIIRWAQDAARLDPSPPSDDEEKIVDHDDDDDESSDDKKAVAPRKGLHQQK